MYLKRETSYVSGLVNMASSCSKKIGLSYAEADCFEVNDYKKEFARLYKIDENDLDLDELNISFEQLLKIVFGEDKDLIDGLVHWIGFVAGDVKKVLTVKEGCSCFDTISDNSSFYYLEDLFPKRNGLIQDF